MKMKMKNKNKEQLVLIPLITTEKNYIEVKKKAKALGMSVPDYFRLLISLIPRTTKIKIYASSVFI